MPHGKQSFNSFSNELCTFNENTGRKRSPRPSKVNHRLELARERPVAENPKLECFLHYKSLLILSNASTQEVKTLEDLIRNSEDKNSTKKGEVEEQAQKSLGGCTVLLNAIKLSEECVEPNKDSDIAGSELEKCFAKLEISTESSSEKPVASDIASVVTARHTYKYKKLRYPKHLERITTSSVLSTSESQDDNSDQKKSTESGSSNNKQPSNCGDPIDYLHPLQEIDVNDSHSKANYNNNDFDVLNPLNEKKATECICRREFHKTRCMSCNEEMNGRTLRRCDFHRKVVFSEDYFLCTKCCADIPQLHEIVNA